MTSAPMIKEDFCGALKGLMDAWDDTKRKLILMGYSERTADALTGRCLSRSLGLTTRKEIAR